MKGLQQEEQPTRLPLNNGTWAEVAEVRASNSGAADNFGLDIYVSGGNIIVGAPFANVNNSQMFTGAAYIFNNACTAISTSIDELAEASTDISLHQNFPNPFSLSTAIQFELDEPGYVKLRVYNLLGQEVAELANGMHTVGEYRVQFDRTDLPGGVYFYALEVGGSNLVRKMTILN